MVKSDDSVLTPRQRGSGQHRAGTGPVKEKGIVAGHPRDPSLDRHVGSTVDVGNSCDGEETAVISACSESVRFDHSIDRQLVVGSPIESVSPVKHNVNIKAGVVSIRIEDRHVATHWIWES